uniref:Uncharacterized protein n=1 Tax=Arundo donax TaxID=35708 RepID=A0A0A9FDQ1_ARUDO
MSSNRAPSMTTEKAWLSMEYMNMPPFEFVQTTNVFGSPKVTHQIWVEDATRSNNNR